MRRPSLLFITVLPITVVCASSLLSAQARDRTPPTTPTNLVVTATTTTSVSLSWGPSTDNSGKFNYYVSGAGPAVIAPQAVTSHTITGLLQGRTYTFKVAARDLSGNNSKSSNAVTVTLPGEIPGAPTKPVVQLLDVGPTHVSLTWSSSDNGPIIWYTIYIDGQMVATTNTRAGSFTCANVMVPTYCVPIDQSTTYTFTVRARDNESNTSLMSDPLFVTTAPADPDDPTPPTQPANVTAQDIGGFQLVSWSSSIDNLAPPSLIRYDIYVDGQLRRVVVGETTAEVDFYFGEQTITVIAVDTANNESAPGTVPIGFWSIGRTLGGRLASDDRPVGVARRVAERREFDQRFGWLTSVLQNQQLGDGGPDRRQWEPSRAMAAFARSRRSLRDRRGPPPRRFATRRRGILRVHS